MRPSYTIGFSGVDQHHQSLVRAMIKRSSTFLSANWEVTEGRPADVLLHGPITPAEAAACRIVARLSPPGESGDGPYDLPDPLRLMSMLTLLERAEHAFLAPQVAVAPALQVSAPPVARAAVTPVPTIAPAAPVGPRPIQVQRQAPVVPAPVAPAPVRAPAPERSPIPVPPPVAPAPVAAPRSAMLILAETISKALASSRPGVIKALVGSHDPMWIDLRQRVFAAPFQLTEMPETGSGIELELIAASDDAPSPVAAPGTNLEKLLWHIGLRAAGARPAPWVDPTARYRLKYWPNFAELPHSINHMNIAARLGSEALTAKEVSEKCRVDMGVVTSSINAMMLMGLLREQTGPEIRQIRTVTKPEQVGRISGLIGRFRSKFGW